MDISPTPFDTPIIEKDNPLYDMNKKRRGPAIIFNQMHFKDERLETRFGTERDEQRLNITLTRLGFDVKIYRDSERKVITETLKEAARADHTDSECIVVVVLTHGNKGSLEAMDGTYLDSEIWEPFTTCKSLIGKPKVFFIQACRGKKLMDGHNVRSVASRIRGDNVDVSPGKCHFKHFSIPTTADLLIMHSTYAGYAAFRWSDGSGSFFIEKLCEEFDLNGTKEHLLEMLTTVCRRVAFDYVANISNSNLMGAKQMPLIISTLTKKLFFTEKNVTEK